jgi:hypothetical protein
MHFALQKKVTAQQKEELNIAMVLLKPFQFSSLFF